jgi:hypothetical protein
MTSNTQTTIEMPATRRLLTVKQFCAQHTAFTPGGIRWLLFHRDQNGLARAVVKVGRRVLIDVDQFFLWIAAQNGR